MFGRLKRAPWYVKLSAFLTLVNWGYLAISGFPVFAAFPGGAWVVIAVALAIPIWWLVVLALIAVVADRLSRCAKPQA